MHDVINLVLDILIAAAFRGTQERGPHEGSGRGKRRSAEGGGLASRLTSGGQSPPL